MKEVFVGALPSSTQIPDIGRTAGKHRHSRTYQDEINTLDEQLVNIDAELGAFDCCALTTTYCHIIHYERVMLIMYTLLK